MKNTKEDYLNYRIDRAKETLGDALLLYENDRWNACINRLYYACFYIVSTLLLSKDILDSIFKFTCTASPII
jgi:uncharacterized protein (UPF0332 family)